MRWKKEFRRAIAASLCLHGLLLVPLLLSRTPPRQAPGDPVISVTLLPDSPASPPKDASATAQAPAEEPMSQRLAQEAEAETPASARPRQEPPARPSPTPPPPGQAPNNPTQQHEEVTATAFYAAGILARAENRSARAALKTLSVPERREQLCDTEAMEQLHRWNSRLQPDRMIAYALKDVVVDAGTLHAAGAAFRSRHRWYELSFDCSIDPSGEAITAFRFTMGEAIARERWAELYLEP